MRPWVRPGEGEPTLLDAAATSGAAARGAGGERCRQQATGGAASIISGTDGAGAPPGSCTRAWPPWVMGAGTTVVFFFRPRPLGMWPRGALLIADSLVAASFTLRTALTLCLF